MPRARRPRTEEEQVYEELRKVLNRSVFMGPRSPSFHQLVKFFFPTVEDAQVGMHLECVLAGGRLKTAEEIAEEMGKYPEKVKQSLETLLSRGAILGRQRRNQPGVLEFMHTGTWALSDMIGVVGKDSGIDPSSTTYGRLTNKYYEEDNYLMEWGASGYPPFRVLIPDAPIAPEAEILHYERASDIVKAQGRLAVGYCNCRIRHKKCDHRIDCCITFGGPADFIVEQAKHIPGAREIPFVTHEEVLKLLDECFREGLVATCMNTDNPKQSQAICLCCPCCCHVVGGYANGITGWGNPKQLQKSNYRPRLDRDTCTLCNKCVEICPVKAWWHHWPHADDLSDDFVFLEKDRCIGCGVCAYNCPAGALTLEKVGVAEIEPSMLAAIERFRRERIH